jgi:carboxylate-amine ligase
VQGSAQRYHALVRQLLRSKSAMDEGMIYFDARLSSHYPTVEIRVPDVCQRVKDAVLVAGLARALVDTAATGWRHAAPAPDVPAMVVRGAGWHAARWGLGDHLVDPRDGVPRAAGQVLEALLHHVEPALRANGDADLVAAGVDRVLARGNGPPASGRCISAFHRCTQSSRTQSRPPSHRRTDRQAPATVQP